RRIQDAELWELDTLQLRATGKDEEGIGKEPQHSVAIQLQDGRHLVPECVAASGIVARWYVGDQLRRPAGVDERLREHAVGDLVVGIGIVVLDVPEVAA